mgnify:FL=1
MVHTIESHPAIALSIGVIHIIAAWLIKHMEIPLIFMQIFQIAAWSITITVGVITIYGAFKKWKQNPKPRKKK